MHNNIKYLRFSLLPRRNVVFLALRRLGGRPPVVISPDTESAFELRPALEVRPLVVEGRPMGVG